MADFSFIPGSLLMYHPKGYITKHGTEGIHYACGWISLAKMLEKYGENYSPLGPLPEPDQSESEESKEKHSEEEDEEEEEEEEAEGNAVAAANHDVEANQTHEDDNDTAVDATAPGANVDNNSQENDEEGNPPPDNASLSLTLECLRKCRDELSWLDANPDFHEEHDTEERRDLIGETINRLYDQISTYNDANNTNETG
jgi:hypothetical protein